MLLNSHTLATTMWGLHPHQSTLRWKYFRLMGLSPLCYVHRAMLTWHISRIPFMYLFRSSSLPLLLSYMFFIVLFYCPILLGL